jgi:hypothetical protein
MEVFSTNAVNEMCKKYLASLGIELLCCIVRFILTKNCLNFFIGQINLN